MKTIHRIQYFLFAIILLGMFASFAQNEYSSILLYDPFLFIGLLFFIEMFLYFKESGGNQSSVLYSFFECLALGLFFCGTFLFIMHWSGAVIPVVAGGLVILILYSGVGIKSLVNKAKNEKGMSLMMFCFALASCLAMIACAFTLKIGRASCRERVCYAV